MNEQTIRAALYDAGYGDDPSPALMERIFRKRLLYARLGLPFTKAALAAMLELPTPKTEKKKEREA